MIRLTVLQNPAGSPAQDLCMRSLPIYNTPPGPLAGTCKSNVFLLLDRELLGAGTVPLLFSAAPAPSPGLVLG